MRYHVYGIDGCDYCTKAVGLLKRQGTPYEYVKIEDDRKKAFLDDMNRVDCDASRTFPRVYIVDGSDFRLVGGYSDLENHMIFG